MTTLFGELLGTVTLRPYVFTFLFFYLLAAIALIGWRRTLLFTFVCWLVAFVSEYSSTRNGFPYGIYHYIDATRGRELWISNVPFMDSLSYTFLQFAAFSVMLFSVYPSRGGRLTLPAKHPQPWKLAAGSALFVMLLDIIIDPVANQGEKWFLGKIYFYPTGGAHFGVPLSNYAGWYLVGLVSVRLYLWLERLMPARHPQRRNWQLTWRGQPLAIDLLGVLLYGGVIGFMFSVTIWIKDWQLLAASLVTALFAAALSLVLRRQNLPR